MDRAKNSPLRLTVVLAALALSLMLTLGFATTAQAKTVTGKLGTNVTYTLNTDTGFCVVSGSGAMKNYSSKSLPFSSSNRKAIRSVKIENDVTSIGSCAFYKCTSLTSISISSTVTCIHSSAFVKCTALTSVTFDGASKCASIYKSAFYGCTSLKSLSIPSSVKSIGASTFYGCSSLPTVSIPSATTSVGTSAFYGCSSLKSALILGTSTKIGNNAFKKIGLNSVIGTKGAVYNSCYGDDEIYSPLRTTMLDISGNHSSAKIKTSKVKAKGLKRGKLRSSKKFKIAVSGVNKNVTRTFKKVSASKKIKKRVKVSKAGKITVKKGAKRGTYKVKVKMSLSLAGYTYKTLTKRIKVVVK